MVSVEPAEPAAPAPAPSAVPADSASPSSPPSTPSREREGRSLRDMGLSLAVLIVPIALVLVFYRVVLGGDAPVSVDPGPVIQEAQQAAVFPVAVPTGLGDNWHVSTATFRRTADGATLRLGYVDPDKDPLQLVESSVAAETLLPVELGKSAKPSGTFRAANRAWRQYDARPGEQALVSTEQNRTLIVIGKADTERLQALAASLS